MRNILRREFLAAGSLRGAPYPEKKVIQEVTDVITREKKFPFLKAALLVTFLSHTLTTQGTPLLEEQIPRLTTFALKKIYNLVRFERSKKNPCPAIITLSKWEHLSFLGAIVSPQVLSINGASRSVWGPGPTCRCPSLFIYPA